jgi:hypothetical protein
MTTQTFDTKEWISENLCPVVATASSTDAEELLSHFETNLTALLNACPRAKYKGQC